MVERFRSCSQVKVISISTHMIHTVRCLCMDIYVYSSIASYSQQSHGLQLHGHVQELPLNFPVHSPQYVRKASNHGEHRTRGSGVSVVYSSLGDHRPREMFEQRRQNGSVVRNLDFLLLIESGRETIPESGHTGGWVWTEQGDLPEDCSASTQIQPMFLQAGAYVVRTLFPFNSVPNLQIEDGWRGGGVDIRERGGKV